MDYLCAKFGAFKFSRFGFIVQTDRENDTHTHTHTDRVTDEDDRYCRRE